MLSKQLLMIFATALTNAYGWGRDGHREVARNAFQKTTAKARKFLKIHGFDNADTFAHGSTWADTDDAVAAYPNSEDYHFAHTPWRRCAPFVMERDCGFGGSGVCIVTGIADMVMIAVDNTSDERMRTDAINFVSHFMADIHQPLHTGFSDDSGGVFIDVLPEPKMSLHQLWDYGLLETDGTSPEAASHEVSHLPGGEIVVRGPIDSREKIISYARDLASESAEHYTCKYAYQHLNGTYIISGDSLDEGYIVRGRSIAFSRLETAGNRLAALLASMAVTYFNNVHGHHTAISTGKTTPFHQANNYFAVLSLDFDPYEIATSRIESISVDNHDLKLNMTTPEPLEQMVCGAPLSEIVLVHHDARFMISCREPFRRNPNYKPIMVTSFMVKLRGRRNGPLLLLVDKTCFAKAHKLTASDLTKIFAHLRGLRGREFDDFVESQDSGGDVVTVKSPELPMLRSRTRPVREVTHKGQQSFSMYGNSSPEFLDRFEKMYEQRLAEVEECKELVRSGGIYPSFEAKWNADFEREKNRIIRVRLQSIRLLLHTNSVLGDIREPMRFTIIPTFDLKSDKTIYTLIDHRIYKGGLTAEIAAEMAAIEKKNLNVMNAIAIRRVTLADELEDLNKLLASSESEKIRGLRIIGEFFSYSINFRGDGDGSFSNILEYSISEKYFDGSILPEIVRLSLNRLSGTLRS